MDTRAAVVVAACLVGCSGAKDMGSGTQMPQSACTTPTEQGPALGTTFNVRFGEQTTIASEGLTLKFDQILGDSRCPEDVLCIWAGEAKIVVRAVRAPDPATNLELNSSGNTPNEATYAGYTVELVGISPETNSTQAIDPDDYCAFLHVERVP